MDNVGIKAAGDTARLYIDELPNVSLDFAAKTAASDTGKQLLRDAIAYGDRESFKDFFNFRGGGLPTFTTQSSSKRSIGSGFLKTIVSPAAGFRGITYNWIRTDDYQRSGLFIKRVYIKSADSAVGQTIRVVDGVIGSPGAIEVDVATIDLVAHRTVNIDIDYVVENEDFSILIDTTLLSTYRANLNSGGCRSCGARYNSRNNFLSKSGGIGINADIELRCNLDLIKKDVYEALDYAMLYKSILFFLENVSGTNRVNEFAMGANKDVYWALIPKYEELYKNELVKTTSNWANRLFTTDRNCFGNSGFDRVSMYG